MIYTFPDWIIFGWIEIRNDKKTTTTTTTVHETIYSNYRNLTFFDVNNKMESDNKVHELNTVPDINEQFW